MFDACWTDEVFKLLDMLFEHLLDKLCQIAPRTLFWVASALQMNMNMNRIEFIRPNQGQALKFIFKDNMHLCTAVDDGDINSMRLLLEKGADVNQANTHGATPLQRAAL